MSYKYISKAGDRFIKQLAGRTHKDRLAINAMQTKMYPEFMKPSLPPAAEEEQFSGVRKWKFLPGDRVVVVKEGKFRGNISKVFSHDKKTNGYMLDENGPTRQVPVPKEYWTEGQKTHMTLIPQAVRQEDIKLVADIDDPDAPGKVRTVAVHDIVFRGSYYDENYKKMMPYRCVAGQEDLVIPWPVPEQTADGALATDPQTAREQTFFVETAVRTPIPNAALYTVRNHKSKYRRGTLTTRDIARLVAPKMPMTESEKAYAKQKEERANIPTHKLTDDDKEAIGAKLYEHFTKNL
ncbi:AAL111Cp [Eremothecium gossypii ATCC 10895]|uniref:AAL111Cp n=1 Tax=Eremothecium gossypii (strain ATCC 10895 / CBS 109.51 / FGSC 9923 / NRRL Y-1056) TaxID=284811 RepID=Q75F39_EREGS|nr:mitochondrial 54S ribosomal protein YmL40 [Eremothecium gossypii ATCC 10895]AAS50255.1 AAL111Cp [Eremothecium gossypii ATCC 10895]AEY94540.1 FAAL111Cp [Eremothecium gossypii FDAG1]